MTQATNDAIKDPAKVAKAECEALLAELELARPRVARLAAAVEEMAWDPDAPTIRQAIRDYRDMTSALDWVCTGRQILDRLAASKPADEPHMERA